MFAFLLLGCSRPNKLFDGYTEQSGDMGAFLIAHASKWGARVPNTNNLPELRAEWRYKEDSGSLQVFVPSNCFNQLHSFLTSAYGAPNSPISKGINRGMATVTTCYTLQELGVGLWYSWYVTKEGENWTQFNMHTEQGLKSGR